MYMIWTMISSALLSCSVTSINECPHTRQRCQGKTWKTVNPALSQEFHVFCEPEHPQRHADTEKNTHCVYGIPVHRQYRYYFLFENFEMYLPGVPTVDCYKSRPKDSWRHLRVLGTCAICICEEYSYTAIVLHFPLRFLSRRYSRFRATRHSIPAHDTSFRFISQNSKLSNEQLSLCLSLSSILYCTFY